MAAPIVCVHVGWMPAQCLENAEKRVARFAHDADVLDERLQTGSLDSCRPLQSAEFMEPNKRVTAV